MTPYTDDTGAQAYRAKIPESACPYPASKPDTLRHRRAWIGGWRPAKETDR